MAEGIRWACSTCVPLRMAEASGTPVVGITEAKPDGVAYQAWLLDQVAALDLALSRP